jgi:hypothetical protein
MSDEDSEAHRTFGCVYSSRATEMLALEESDLVFTLKALDSRGTHPTASGLGCWG